MLLDDLLKELEPLKGNGYIVCFDDKHEKGLNQYKDIEYIEVEEDPGIIHLREQPNGGKESHG